MLSARGTTSPHHHQVEREVVEVLMKALQQVEPELSHLEPTSDK